MQPSQTKTNIEYTQEGDLLLSLCIVNKSAVSLEAWILRGVVSNVRGAKRYYPDFVVRVYCTDCSASDEASILVFDNAELVRCRNDTILDQGTGRKAMKRFLVFDDPSVLYFISRDVDSRFSPRELMAVNEWINSKLGFHTMHDHVWHSDVILA